MSGVFANKGARVVSTRVLKFCVDVLFLVIVVANGSLGIVLGRCCGLVIVFADGVLRQAPLRVSWL